MVYIFILICLNTEIVRKKIVGGQGRIAWKFIMKKTQDTTKVQNINTIITGMITRSPTKHTCTHLHTHVYIYTYVHTHTYTHTHTHIYIYII